MSLDSYIFQPNSYLIIQFFVGNGQIKIESLLNQVSIENDESFACQVEPQLTKNDINHSEDKAKSSFQLQTRPFHLQQQQQQQVNENWPNPPNYLVVDKSSVLNDELAQNLNSNLSDLKALMVQMSKTLKSQHDEIEHIKKQQISSQSQMKSHMDASLKQFLITQQQRSSTMQQQQQQMSLVSDENQLSLLIQQGLNKNLQPKLEQLLKEEINKSIQTQFVTRLMEPLREQITRDLAEKLKSIEAVMKDSIIKLFKSKSTMDVLSQAIVSSQQATICNSYRETFQKVIVPNFEKSCQNMYQQVNCSFSKGTQDYLMEFDQLAKQHRKMFDENNEPILAQMKNFNEQMQSHSTQMANILANNLQQQFETNLR